MPDLLLYHFPTACSQVSCVALEETGLAHRIELVDLRAGDQFRPDFVLMSPLSKVPVLLVDGAPLTENVAILAYIAALRPEAGLLPGWDDPRAAAEAQSGLSFCSATLHPIVRGLGNPSRISAGETEGVRARSLEMAAKAFGHVDRRLAERGWWLGQWSIVDVYLNWAFSIAARNGFDPASVPDLAGLRTRLLKRPAFAKVMTEEEKGCALFGLEPLAAQR